MPRYLCSTTHFGVRMEWYRDDLEEARTAIPIPKCNDCLEDYGLSKKGNTSNWKTIALIKVRDDFEKP